MNLRDWNIAITAPSTFVPTVCLQNKQKLVFWRSDFFFLIILEVLDGINNQTFVSLLCGFKMTIPHIYFRIELRFHFPTATMREHFNHLWLTSQSSLVFPITSSFFPDVGMLMMQEGMVKGDSMGPPDYDGRGNIVRASCRVLLITCVCVQKSALTICLPICSVPNY